MLIQSELKASFNMNTPIGGTYVQKVRGSLAYFSAEGVKFLEPMDPAWRGTNNPIYGAFTTGLKTMYRL